MVSVVNVLFQTPPDVFQDLVNNRDDEIGVISIQIVCKHCHQPDISIVEFPRFRERLMEREPDGYVTPVELPDEFENFIDRAFGKNIIDEMPDEKFHNGSLLLFTGRAFRGITLIRGKGKQVHDKP